MAIPSPDDNATGIAAHDEGGLGRRDTVPRSENYRRVQTDGLDITRTGRTPTGNSTDNFVLANRREQTSPVRIIVTRSLSAG